MKDNNQLFNELEMMEINKAPFTDYFHKMIEIIDHQERNQRAILLYKVISQIRDLGYEEGAKKKSESIINFINNQQR